MDSYAIRVHGLGKRYRIGSAAERHDTLRDAIAAGLRSPLRRFKKLRQLSRFTRDDASDVIWALRDVTFDVSEGEVLGVVGRNGAGKSTLLKILSRVTDPTEGHAILRGRVGCLLEVGTGFHPELTGRDNVYLNGAILGMQRSHIDRLFDEIVAFSGVEKFIDTPVKRYSSGMRVRLAFAVAAHLQPEVLVIDEVLSVGDADFQKKCLGKMESVAKSGRTVLFVSHNLHAVRSLCSRCLWIDSGAVRLDGQPRDVIDAYLGAFRQGVNGGQVSLEDWPDRDGGAKVRILAARVLGPDDDVLAEVYRRDCLTVEYDLQSDYEEDLVFTAIVNSEDGDRVLNLSHFDSPEGMVRRLSGRHTIRFQVPNLPLAAGRYTITLGVLTRQMKPLDVVWQALPLVVGDDPDSPRPYETSFEWGFCTVPSVWSVRPADQTAPGRSREPERRM